MVKIVEVRKSCRRRFFISLLKGNDLSLVVVVVDVVVVVVVVLVVVVLVVVDVVVVVCKNISYHKVVFVFGVH
jgi:hypothetical protein